MCVCVAACVCARVLVYVSFVYVFVCLCVRVRVPWPPLGRVGLPVSATFVGCRWFCMLGFVFPLVFRPIQRLHCSNAPKLQSTTLVTFNKATGKEATERAPMTLNGITLRWLFALCGFPCPVLALISHDWRLYSS